MKSDPKTGGSSKSIANIIDQISFPLPQKVSANQIYSTMHWSKRQQVKDLYHLFMLQYKNKLKFEEKDYPLRVSYLIEWKKRPLDATNQFPIIKMIEDGMVMAGILRGDDCKSIREIVSKTVHNPKIEHDTITVVFEACV